VADRVGGLRHPSVLLGDPILESGYTSTVRAYLLMVAGAAYVSDSPAEMGMFAMWAAPVAYKICSQVVFFSADLLGI
jgi:hypothetical protein